MKKRVRKTQRLTIWDRIQNQFRDVVVKHDHSRPVRMSNRDRMFIYDKQNGLPPGTQRFTPRQRRRLVHKHDHQPMPRPAKGERVNRPNHLASPRP